MTDETTHPLVVLHERVGKIDARQALDGLLAAGMCLFSPPIAMQVPHGAEQEVEGYAIPVLNEREIRASAGILFLILFISILVAILKGNFLLIKYAITIFLTDISVRVLVNPDSLLP